MDSARINALLESRGATVDATMEREISLSSHYLRALVAGVPTFAVGSERHVDERMDALVDAVHWCRHRHPHAEVPFQLPTSWTKGGRARYLDLLLRDGDGVVVAASDFNVEVVELDGGT